MKAIVYLGYNNPQNHKRGVENVIHFQSKTVNNVKKYYIFFDRSNNVTEFFWDDILCIGIPHNYLRFIKLNLKLLEIKKNSSSLIVHSHNPLMSFFYLGNTDLITVHDGLYYQSKSTNHRLSKLFYYIEKKVYQRVKNVHFISDFTKSQSLFSGEAYNKIYNTTPFEFIHTENDVHEKKVTSEKNKLFTVRSIEERARIDLLIDLAQKRKDLHIKVAGKGPLLEEYRNKIIEKKIDNIELLGFLSDEDVIQNYKKCDVVIVPAEYGEGFGLPIIEGYLFNKPVIASNICAIPEIIIDGKYLFENNILSIEKALENIDFELDFKDYYDKNFSIKVIYEKYRIMYNNIFLTKGMVK